MPSLAPPELGTLPAPPIETRSLELPLLLTDLDRLRIRGLVLPVQGVGGKSLRDTFPDDRGGRRHQAIDIMAPHGTPVLAVDDGRVEKLFTSKQGGLTVYQFDERGEYCYYYAHLDGYAAGLEPAKVLGRGDVIGYVGSTGNASAEAPHLHFTIFRLGPDQRWWEGTAINAYPLWGPPTRS
jgi:murein DD-endopeptidase MepM/ murein hydrolase activator NlpD